MHYDDEIGFGDLKCNDLLEWEKLRKELEDNSGKNDRKCKENT